MCLANKNSWCLSRFSISKNQRLHSQNPPILPFKPEIPRTSQFRTSSGLGCAKTHLNAGCINFDPQFCDNVPFFGWVWWKTGWNGDLQCLGGMKLGQELSRIGLSSTQMFSFNGSQWTTMVVEFFVWKELQNKKNDCKKGERLPWICGVLLLHPMICHMLDNSIQKRLNPRNSKKFFWKKGANLCQCVCVSRKDSSSISPRTQRISLKKREKREVYNFTIFCSDFFPTKKQQKNKTSNVTTRRHPQKPPGPWPWPWPSQRGTTTKSIEQ